MFRKLDLFPSSGEGGEPSTLLGVLERANLSHWNSEKTDEVSEMLCSLMFFLEYRTMEKVQNLVIPSVIHHC
jgi:hypothetical protein